MSAQATLLDEPKQRMDSPWPGGIAPRHIAAKALERIYAEKPTTKEETWGIVDAVLEEHPGVAREIIVSHVRRELAVGRVKKRNPAPRDVSQAKPGKCKSCGRKILWHETRNSTPEKRKWMPLDPSGAPHWDTCPTAHEHRKK